MNRIDLNDIRLLMQVVESGSYTAASRLNGMPKSTISQRIAALERAVGTGLLRRTSRSFSLTETGALLLPHAREIEELSRKLEQQLFEQGDSVAGTLRITLFNRLIPVRAFRNSCQGSWNSTEARSFAWRPAIAWWTSWAKAMTWPSEAISAH